MNGLSERGHDAPAGGSMRLIGSDLSPYVRKVRVYLSETGREMPFERVDVWTDEIWHGTADPVGKIPILICPDGGTLTESLLVVDYLDRLAEPERRLTPANPHAVLMTRRRQVSAQVLIDATVERLLEGRRPSAQQCTDRIERQEARISRVLAHEEASLAQGKWPTCDSFGLGEIDMAVALQYVDFRYPHDWRARCPRLSVWAAETRERPSLFATQPHGFTPIV
ncbi:glutathione S-transferase N-terminal domain-containing protein [Marinibacterium sp. SX1]|uniref:glutathione S-transferase N-terminal domain-containing protein n=1 Tax=Marinibacterium sp. SX1 TaxID=3388424 RepID=UPI003D17927F